MESKCKARRDNRRAVIGASRALVLCAAVIACLPAANASETMGNDTSVSTSVGFANRYALDEAALRAFIAATAGGLHITEIFRIFENGELMPESLAIPPMVFEVAERNMLTGSLTAYGRISGQKYIEDIRMIETDGELFLVRDRYAESEARQRTGRSIPVFLHAGDGAMAGGSATGTTLKAVAVVPKISGVGGRDVPSAEISSGVLQESCGKKWNGMRAVDYYAGVLPWVINGSGFGAAGTVYIDNKPVKATSWSPNQITIDPTMPNLTAAQTSALKVVTSTSGSATFMVSIVPSIMARPFGQCTFFATQQRLFQGKSIPGKGGAYQGFSSIDGAYIPHQGDAYKTDNDGHQWIVMSATLDTATSINGVKRWKIQAADMNATCSNELHTWSTTFAVKTANGKTTVIEFPRHWLATPTYAHFYFP